MDEKKERKRTQNYTEQEKSVLLSIISKYQRIIENKTTNSVFNKQKLATWEKIAREYNAVAISGKREAEQLRNLYANLKQKTRKTVAKENREKFKQNNEKKNNEERPNTILQEITNNEIKDLKKKANDDKKEIFKTGGGSYVKKITDTDAQVLALIAPQIKPLPNPYDDAASYFGDDNITNNITVPALPDEEPIVDVMEPPILLDATEPIMEMYEYVQETNNPTQVEVYDDYSDDIPLETTTQHIEDVTIDKSIKTIHKRKINDKKSRYFAMKLQNAKLEQLNIKMQRKHNLHLYNLKVSLLKNKIRYSQALLKRVKK